MSRSWTSSCGCLAQKTVESADLLDAFAKAAPALLLRLSATEGITASADEVPVRPGLAWLGEQLLAEGPRAARD